MKDEYCKKCPLYEMPYVKPQLHKASNILFVGQSPGTDEVATGYHLCHKGESGSLFRKYTDLLPFIYSVTDCVLCFTGNKVPNKKEIDFCNPKLLEAIEYTSPKLIVPLGKPAVQAVLGRRDSLLKLNGKLIGGDIPVIPCVHPSYVTGYGQDESIFEKGILPAINHFSKESELTIKKKDTIEPNKEDVGFDIETNSLRPDGVLRCFSVSNGESAIFVEVEDD